MAGSERASGCILREGISKLFFHFPSARAALPERGIGKPLRGGVCVFRVDGEMGWGGGSGRERVISCVVISDPGLNLSVFVNTIM